jgi:hypothetical protein
MGEQGRGREVEKERVAGGGLFPAKILNLLLTQNLSLFFPKFEAHKF